MRRRADNARLQACVLELLILHSNGKRTVSVLCLIWHVSNEQGGTNAACVNRLDVKRGVVSRPRSNRMPYH
jgi:hypothetical protein